MLHATIAQYFVGFREYVVGEVKFFGIVEENHFYEKGKVLLVGVELLSKKTRIDRPKSDKLSPIREVFYNFVSKCRKCHSR
jgi:hypothetical protein